MTSKSPQDWRADKRAAIEAVFSTARRRGDSQRHLSPSARYELEVITWEPPQGWRYSEGIVRRVGSAEPVAVIRRNYGAFPFTWCERHPTGHDYLIAGEDYLGQTVVELDSGDRVDHLPDMAEQGDGFCWARHHLAPQGTVLIVDGCFWASPYELVAFDFSEPMQLPYAELDRWIGELAIVDGFDDHGSLAWTFQQGIRLSDGKPSADLTDEEENELLDDHGRYRSGVFGTQTCRARWQAGTPFESTEVQAIGTAND